VVGLAEGGTPVSDYLLGLATVPAFALLAFAGTLARRFVIYRIQRLKAANVHQRAALASRLFGSKRAWMWSSTRFAVAVTAGWSMTTADQAEAVLLDEFEPKVTP
jgi:hypothetical protein